MDIVIIKNGENMEIKQEIFEKYCKKDGEIHTTDWLLKKAIQESYAAGKLSVDMDFTKQLLKLESRIAKKIFDGIDREIDFSAAPIGLIREMDYQAFKKKYIIK